MDGEGVDATFEFGRERFIHHTVALDPALPSERFRHNINAEMGFAAWAMAGMPRVLVGFVNHIEAQRREGPGQLIQDGVTSTHESRLAASGSGGQCGFSGGRRGFVFVKT